MYERIRNLREDKDYNQEKMAQMLSVSQSTYSDYERGEINIPLKTLVKLADILETSIDYLLERTDEKTPYSPAKRKI